MTLDPFGSPIFTIELKERQIIKFKVILPSDPRNDSADKKAKIIPPSSITNLLGTHWSAPVRTTNRGYTTLWGYFEDGQRVGDIFYYGIADPIQK
jgi:hypothetical protein